MTSHRSLLKASLTVFALAACNDSPAGTDGVRSMVSLADGSLAFSATATTVQNQETGTNITVQVRAKNTTSERLSVAGVCAVQLRAINAAGAVSWLKPAQLASCLATDRKVGAGETYNVPWREFTGTVTARDLMGDGTAGTFGLNALVRVGTDTLALDLGKISFTRTITTPPATVPAVPNEVAVADVRYHVEVSHTEGQATATLKLRVTNTTTARQFTLHGAAGATCASTLSGYASADARNRYANADAKPAWTYDGCAFVLNNVGLAPGETKLLESPPIDFATLSKYSRLLLLSVARDATSEVKQVALAP